MKGKQLICNLPILESDSLIFRKFDDKDANDLYEIMSDEKNMTYINATSYINIAQAVDKIDELKYMYSQKSVVNYAIENKENQKVIGNVFLYNVDAKNMSAELRIHIKQ